MPDTTTITALAHEANRAIRAAEELYGSWTAAKAACLAVARACEAAGSGAPKTWRAKARSINNTRLRRR